MANIISIRNQQIIEKMLTYNKNKRENFLNLIGRIKERR